MSPKQLNPFIRLLPALAILVAVLAAAASAEEPERIEKLETLQSKVRQLHEDSANTALGIALIDRGELVWLDAEGMANIEHQVPATPDSLFRIGSTSKMFTALAILKLVEEGRLDLNTPLRELVPEIEFHNPWEDEHPVRLVHLLEHTSGWHDTSMAEYAHNDPSPTVLGEVIHEFSEERRSRWVPGTRHAYSNTGTGVASYVVEKVTGMPFEEYVQRELFDTLGMETATYLLPDNAVDVLSQPYIDDQAQDYWHIIYRAAGAINASPREMAKLLQFYLNRGQVDEQTLLPASAIDRMETPHTTLANAQGVTAGYGLANYTTGFERYHVAFHGHNGGMMGAMSDLSYSPELNGGYSIAVTGGDWGALQAIADAIRDYLLRDRAPPELDPSALPEPLQALEGIYRPINPRRDFAQALPLALEAMTFRTDETYLHRMPLLGSWDAPSNDYTEDGKTLIDQSTGLPSVAIVRDPLAGDAVQVSTGLYQRTSGLWVWSQLLVLGGTLLFSVLALLYALVWFPLTLVRKRLTHPSAQLQAWPLLSCALLLAIALCLAFGTSDFTAMVPWTFVSVSLFVLTLAYGLSAAWNLAILYRLRNAGIRRWLYGLWAIMILLHTVMAVHLASHGMIGARIWTW